MKCRLPSCRKDFTPPDDRVAYCSPLCSHRATLAGKRKWAKATWKSKRKAANTRRQIRKRERAR